MDTPRTGAVVPSLLAAVAALGAAALALINPTFTPRHFLDGASAIVPLTLTPGADGAWTVAAGTPIKGAAPALSALSAAGQAADELDTERGDKPSRSAILLMGDFSAAAEPAKAAQLTTKPAGALLAGGKWFLAYAETDGRWRLESDTVLDLRTVWAGSDGMLARGFQWLAQDPSADLPVKGDANWVEPPVLATVGETKPGSGLLVADLDGDGQAEIVVGAASGLRILKRSGEAWSVTPLGGPANALAVADVDGDGRLDLAFTHPDGQGVASKLQQADGAYADGPTAPLTGIVGLHLVGSVGGKAVLLAQGPERRPALLIPGAAGWTVQELDTTGPACVAEVTGDRFADVVVAGPKAITVFPGTGSGVGAALVRAVGFVSAGPLSLRPGDFDQDGRIDLCVAGSDGPGILVQQADGGFEHWFEQTGELAYGTQDVRDTVVSDYTGDGRQDTLLLQPGQLFKPYFNRGYVTFGYANDLNPEGGGMHGADAGKGVGAALPKLRNGVAAATAGDVLGDAAEEQVLLTPAGEVLLLATQAMPAVSRTTLRVTLPAGAAPALVRAMDGLRPLGARMVLPGQPAVFPKRGKGPLTLTWTGADGKPVVKTVPVLKPTAFVLP